MKRPSVKTQTLFLSVFLNIALLSLFAYFLIRENSLQLLFAYRQAPEERWNPPAHDVEHSPEFIVLQTLFERADHRVGRDKVLQLMEEDREVLDRYYQQQQAGTDFSDTRRRVFLMEMVAKRSSVAAELLVITDKEFLLQRDDATLVFIVALLREPSQDVVAFLEELLSLERSDAVQQIAIERYAQCKGVAKEEVAARYFNRPGQGNLRPLFREMTPPAPAQNVYVVKKGESLWLIAERHNVSVEDLMQANGLRSTTLQPGFLLKIPPPCAPQSGGS